MKKFFLIALLAFSTLLGSGAEYASYLQAFSLQDFWSDLWEEKPVLTIQQYQLQPEMQKDFEDLHRSFIADYHRFIDGQFILDEKKGESGVLVEDESKLGTFDFVSDSESRERYSFREGVLFATGKHAEQYQNYLRRSVGLLTSLNEEFEESLDIACRICTQKQRIEIQCPVCY